MKLFFKKAYFDGKLSAGFVALYTGKMIVLVASDLLGIFLPIFLYTIFHNNIQPLLFYYGISSLLYAIVVAWGALQLNRFGFRRALRWSALFGALFYVVVYFVRPENAVPLLTLSIVVATIYRVLYWVPYHVDFAKFTDRKNRAKEVSLLAATGDILGVFIPLVAGFFIARFGFQVLFVMAMVLYGISVIPYITLPHAHEKFGWSYRTTWQKLFARDRRATTLAFMANGAESVVATIIWPVFIFQLLSGNYFEVGAISSLIVGAAVLLQLFLGKSIDAAVEREEKLLHAGSVLYALGWILKMFIVTAFHLFIVGAYHSIMKIVMRIPFDALTYEVAADQGHYVDEFSVLHEMAIHLGRVLMIVVAMVMATFLPLQWTFVLAAVSAIALNTLLDARRSTRDITVRVAL